MNRHHPPFRLGVFGKSGYGKTEFVLRYLRGVAKAKCIFIYDPEGEFAEELGTYGARTPAELVAQIKSGWVVYDPSQMFRGNFVAGFNFFCDFAFKASQTFRGRKIFVSDECWRYLRTSELPEPVAELLNTGRRHELDSIFISQRPNKINNEIRDSLTEVVCFRLVTDRALEFPEEYGFDPQEVRSLPKYHYISMNDAGVEFRSGGQRAGAVGAKAENSSKRPEAKPHPSKKL